MGSTPLGSPLMAENGQTIATGWGILKAWMVPLREAMSIKVTAAEEDRAMSLRLPPGLPEFEGEIRIERGAGCEASGSSSICGGSSDAEP